MMKKLILSLATIALVVTGIFTFAGCEKEESTETNNQIIKASETYDGPWKVVKEIHKIGGTPVTFLGIPIGVRYNTVSKEYHFVDVNGEHVEKIVITCENAGPNPCRINGHSYGTGPGNNEEWMEINEGIFINRTEMFVIMDNLSDSVDVQLLQVGRFSGSMSKIELLHTIDEATIPIHFDVIWENGNSDGDADINITAYYDTEN